MSAKPCQLCRRMFTHFPWGIDDRMMCQECRDKEQAMLVCDSCEGREDVKFTRIVACARLEADLSMSIPHIADERVDLCVHCRNRLARVIKEAVAPQPKPLQRRRSVAGETFTELHSEQNG